MFPQNDPSIIPG